MRSLNIYYREAREYAYRGDDEHLTPRCSEADENGFRDDGEHVDLRCYEAGGTFAAMLAKPS